MNGLKKRLVNIQYPEKLHNLHNDLSFLSEKIKIEKIEKLVANLHDSKEYILLIRNLKQALNHELVLKKVRRFIIKFNPKALLEPYIDMDTELKKKKQKMIFKKIF